MNRSIARFLIVSVLLLVFAVAGCRRDEPQAPVTRAPNDPVAAVEAQAQALRDDDLVRWAKLAMPPALYARLDAQRRRTATEPVDEDDAREYAEWMARLTAPDAETALMRDVDAKLAEFEAEVGDQWPLMQAAMAMFIQAAIEANGDIEASEKAHARDLAGGFVYWIKPTLVADRERARRAIAEVTATARALDLPTLEQVQALPLDEALAKAGIVFAGLKRVAKVYDVDLDAALDAVRVEAVSVDGDGAVVRVGYPLFGRDLRFEMPMQRFDGGWYSASTVRDIEADLREVEAEADDAIAEATDAETTDADAAGDAAVPAPEADDAR
ncbi:hypothetical protein [Arenimonas composti]|uniref:Uncharacterized protein n=1 Tax=Arenimonas composti TR7-09 = DSM 18010 TaxID=1121013 RepID=A0A091BDG7_9GAMM|nr:hypothetical protein [Arenimonas composti]KFN49557.1 hypothetical protein P873_10410 [Arenimonas composti TR7-09 = DSM 18010]